jgi:N-acetylmuramic acid 6-phosphate etherase
VTKTTPFLERLGIHPTRECRDFIQNKTQFHLHHLPTEQRHPSTFNLSGILAKNTAAGLRRLLDVDLDIARSLEKKWAQRPHLLEQAAYAVKSALLSGRLIYIYGCGATGRLAKQMESTFWRPFWKRLWADADTQRKIRAWPGTPPQDRLIGEMTGGDRALISSLEGFEDLSLVGRLQLQNHGIQRGDVVMCVTEGGETSSVIGAITAARKQWKVSGKDDWDNARRRLYFIYNNPDETLRPLERSRRVLDDPGISRINLTTGPQALAGSTRMQAATIETYVIGHILQAGAELALREILSSAEMEKLGFAPGIDMHARLIRFRELLREIRRAVPALTRLTEREAGVYAAGQKSTYFAEDALITVFIDSTERSPTFRLLPLDTVDRDERRCWIQVWTGAETSAEAWSGFLGRPFRGLNPEFYRGPFETNISDSYLRKAALRSLQQAGDDQQYLYDFSLSPFNLAKRKPRPGDLGLAVAVDGELSRFKKNGSGFRRFFQILDKNGIPKNLIASVEHPHSEWEKVLKEIPEWDSRRDIAVLVSLETAGDPMEIDRHVALKMILNAHSTAVMVHLGRVSGNSMAYVQPANLKLIGRAAYLIQSHVNEILNHSALSYAEAAAALFEAMEFLKDKPNTGEAAEVPLAVIRVAESIRRSAPVTQEQAWKIYQQEDLRTYAKNASA